MLAMLSSSALFSAVSNLLFLVHHIGFHLCACLLHGLDDIDHIVLCSAQADFPLMGPCFMQTAIV